MLELFEGKLSLDDILNNDLPYVRTLVAAKEKYIIEKEKARRKAENESLKDVKKK